MLRDIIFYKRLSLYLSGLLVLSLGVVLSIQASLGVSPVSSVPYALALVFPFSVGTMVIAFNVLCLILQKLFKSPLSLKGAMEQLIASLLFSIFIDLQLFLLSDVFPAAVDMWVRLLYLAISFVLMAIGLLLYTTAQFSLLSYDALTYAIVHFMNWSFSKAKISCDLMSVCISTAIGIIFLNSLGSIGLGTLLAAYFIGKTAGLLMRQYQQRLHNWVYSDYPTH